MVQKRDNIALDIIEALRKEDNHIRGLAKTLNASHSTVLRTLNMLKEEHIIDSKEEGKNKRFFLKENLLSKTYLLQAEMHKLATCLQHAPELRIILENVLKTSDEALIVLFGSYAKGRAKKESDIDLYIETEDRNVKKAVEAVHSKINVKIGRFDTKTPLIKEIIKNHVIVRGVEIFYAKHLPQ